MLTFIWYLIWHIFWPFTIHSDILFDVYSDIFFVIVSASLSDISSMAFFLSFDLAFYLKFYMVFDLSFYLAFNLAVYLAFDLTLYMAFFGPLDLALCHLYLTFFMALGIYLIYLTFDLLASFWKPGSGMFKSRDTQHAPWWGKQDAMICHEDMDVSVQSWGYPQSPITFYRIFRYKASSYWGIPICGTPQDPPILWRGGHGPAKAVGSSDSKVKLISKIASKIPKWIGCMGENCYLDVFGCIWYFLFWGKIQSPYTSRLRKDFVR
jgi:hypothetical protein